MTVTDGPGWQDDCAFPPHPGEDDGIPFVAGDDGAWGMPSLVAESAWGRFRAWLGTAPAERVPLAAVPVVWTAAEVMHVVGVNGWWPGLGTVVAAIGAGWAGEHRAGDPDDPRPREHRMGGGHAAGLTAAAGSWLTAATVIGPTSPPWWWLTIAGGVGGGAGYRWLWKHPALAAARARRAGTARENAELIAQKTAWHRLAAELGMDGSHLVQYDKTKLGDARLINTKRTGRRASHWAGRGLAEHIAEIENLRPGQVETYVDRKAGFMWIVTRRAEPWGKPVWHPWASGTLDASSEYAAFTPPGDTITRPRVIGIDPETGDPMPLALWDKGGGKVIAIAAMKEGGKTNLMDVICEGVTRCVDAVLLQINLSKALEDGWWEPLTAASALDRQVRKARAILRFLVAVIRERPRSGRTTRVHQPTPQAPAYILKIDEYDKVVRDPACARDLKEIESTCRSEGVTLVKAGQSARAADQGGGKSRAMVDIAVWGRFARGGEVGHVAGRDADLPDMGEYGDGAAGVFGVARLPYQDGEMTRGRTFYWGEENTGLLTLIRDRARVQLPFVLEPALAGLQPLWDDVLSGGQGAGEDDDDEDLDDGYDGEEQAPARRRPSPAPKGTGRIAGKIRNARDLAEEEPELTPIPPGMEAHVEEQMAKRRRAGLAEYTDVVISEGDRRTVLAMLTEPGGTTSADVASRLGVSRTTAHQYLARLMEERAAVKREDGHGYQAGGGPPPEDDGEGEPHAQVLQFHPRAGGDTR